LANSKEFERARAEFERDVTLLQYLLVRPLLKLTC